MSSERQTCAERVGSRLFPTTRRASLPRVRAPSPTVLAGARVCLEPLEERHRVDLEAAVAADPGAFTLSGPVPSLGVEAWIARALVERASGERLPYAVVLAEDGRAV